MRILVLRVVGVMESCKTIRACLDVSRVLRSNLKVLKNSKLYMGTFHSISLPVVDP